MPLFLNNQIIKEFIFPGGECQIQLPTLQLPKTVALTAHLTNANDLVSLLLSINAIQESSPETQIDLNIPYFPYARQDRICNPGEAFSLKVIASLINNLNCKSVTIVDPHSDVTPALLNNCKIIPMHYIIEKSKLCDFILNNKLTLVSPDAGAEKKVQQVAKSLSTEKETVDVVYARKIRDISSGKIIQTKIYDTLSRENFIILDDICDGGATFIALAKELKNLGAKNIYLYVTHGIFSKALSALKPYFNHIFCYQTMLNELQIDNKFLTIL